MPQPSASWLQRYVSGGHAPGDDEATRLRKSSLTLVASIVCVASPAWIATYLLLGRPLPAAIPAAYVAFSVVGLGWLFATKRDHVFLVTQVAAMFALPIALQWTLGGFVNGSAVALWSFASVLVALVAWGARVAVPLFAAFVAAMLLSGVAEATLRASTASLPQPVVTAFFVLDVVAPLATAFALLLYFNRERDAALASSDSLLHNILPAAAVRQLKAGRRRIADRCEDASVLFVDFVEFTGFAERTEPERVVELLDRAFSTLDELASRFGVEKIKTLGDGYLAAAGVTDRRTDHVDAAARMALAVDTELQRSLGDDWPELRTRIGMAAGPVIAGVIGQRRLGFDLWGDTVNTAARMASHAEPGEIQVTETVAAALGPRYTLARRDAVAVKGKGAMTTYVLLGPR